MKYLVSGRVYKLFLLIKEKTINSKGYRQNSAFKEKESVRLYYWYQKEKVWGGSTHG